MTTYEQTEIVEYTQINFEYIGPNFTHFYSNQ